VQEMQQLFQDVVTGRKVRCAVRRRYMRESVQIAKRVGDLNRDGSVKVVRRSEVKRYSSPEFRT
jgi:hypothetical protein